jgi:hypothetical protein
MNFDLSPYVSHLKSIVANAPDFSRAVARSLGPKRGLLITTATFALFVPVLIACVAAAEVRHQFFYAQSTRGADGLRGSIAKLDSDLARVASNAAIVGSPSPEVATPIQLSYSLPLPRARPQSSASRYAGLQQSHPAVFTENRRSKRGD